MLSKVGQRLRRASRLRRALRRVAGGKPRLSVYRSSKNIYAQVIDDAKGVTLCSCSTLDKALRAKLKSGSDKAAAAAVGKQLAARAKKLKIGAVVFDRGPYLYHGRIRALAEAAREGGMQF